MERRDIVSEQSKASSREELPYILRGRQFGEDDLQVIRRCVEDYFDKGRTRISEVICEELGWKQPNGWLKDRACRDVLVRLARLGEIELPPMLTSRRVEAKTTTGPEKSYLTEFDLTSPIVDLPGDPILEFAKGNHAEKVWNEVVAQYHYRGHKVIVGRCIKYLIMGGGRLLGALAFSSPSWGLAPRDALLQELGISLDEIPNKVINNSRFLILPNVKVPNLASRLLSLATRRVVLDWSAYYSITPQVAETFVEGSMFLGTCYRAANWMEIGLTKGYAKQGGTHHNSQKPKQIYLFGLHRSMQRKLLRALSEDRGAAR